MDAAVTVFGNLAGRARGSALAVLDLICSCAHDSACPTPRSAGTGSPAEARSPASSTASTSAIPTGEPIRSRWPGDGPDPEPGHRHGGRHRRRGHRRRRADDRLLRYREHESGAGCAQPGARRRNGDHRRRRHSGCPVVGPPLRPAGSAERLPLSAAARAHPDGTVLSAPSMSVHSDTGETRIWPI